MGETKSVTICWENYLQCLSDRIWSFFNANELVDVTLTCHEQSMEVHGFVLSLFSPVLKESLTSGGDDISQHNIRHPHQTVNLDFVTDQATDVKYLLEFLYRGQVTLPESRLKHLLNTAGLLGVQKLVDAIHSIRCQSINVIQQVQEELEATQGFGEVPVNEFESIPLGAGINNSNNEEMSDLDDTPKQSIGKLILNANCGFDEKTLKDGVQSQELYYSTNVSMGNSLDASDTRDGLVDFKSESESESAQKADVFSSIKVNKDEDGEGTESLDDKESEGKEHKKCKRKAYQQTWRKSRPFLECPHCDYKSRDSSNFKKHMEHHESTYGLHKYVCEICSKTFRSRRGFKCHQLGHGDPERQHQCFVCNFCTPQRWSLIKHLAVMHKVDEKGIPIAENIKCTQCDYCCIADHQLKAHILRKHTDPLNKPFKCEQCSYSTVIKYELEKHVGIRHRNERRYMCEYCSFRSQTHSGLVRHQRAHSGIKPYKCQVCGMEYADGGKFKAHIIRHSKDEKGFICHICAHACRRKDNLRMHLRRIHGTDLDETGDAIMVKMGAIKETQTIGLGLLSSEL